MLLVATGRHIGGMLSGGLSRSDIERQGRLLGGLTADVFQRIGAHYGQAVAWRFEPHVAEAVLDELLTEAGVTVVPEAPLAKVDVRDDRIVGVLAGEATIEAAVWVDASYEGDLMAAVGVTYAVGRESRELHGEGLAGRREILPNPHQARAAVSALGVTGELLPGAIPYDAIGPIGAGDGKLQAYCYRLCLSRAPDRLPLAAPPGYDRSRYVLVERYLAALARDGVRPVMHDVIGISEVPGDKADVNSHGPFSTDLLGASWGYPVAAQPERDRIAAEHRDWAAGLLHFLATDAAVPGEIAALLEPYGYPADEFTDSDGWPHQLYVREARRMVGEHVLTEADLLGGRIPGDTVGLAGYNIDIREVQWVACPISRFPDVHKEVLVEGYLSVPVPAYGIPYRSLLPRRTEVPNLLVCGAISASSVAYASFRMEPQFMIAGHAAGTAAAQAARRRVAVHEIDVDVLRADLAAAGQVLAVR